MAVERIAQMNFGARSLQLPAYFPSVSSVKTAMPPREYVRLLASSVGLNGQFLVSAFDLAGLDDPEAVGEMLAAAREAGAVTLMDCGNYESFWRHAQTDWKQADFHRMLGVFPCDLAFSFDEQSPPKNPGEHIRLIVSRWQADQDTAGSCQVVPIIHAAAGDLPALCLAVARDTGVWMLAVPERALGDGVLERAQTVRSIRAALDESGSYVVLHLLGTGNPISLAVYTAMGADSFDGLEWCQTVVDHDTALLYHLSHADFFAGQTEWGSADLSFQARTLAHNLEFFADWMGRLRAAVLKDRVGDFCRANLPIRAFQHFAKVAGWRL